MKKMVWGYGLAAALALLAGQARAQSSSNTSPTGDTSKDTSGTMGSGSSSMGPGSSSTGSGTSATSEPSSSSTTSGHFNALTGKVERFDRSKNELTLAGSDRKLKVDSSTKVMRDGSRASLDDIKEGDQVRASYSGSGDTLRVKSLDITSSGSMGGTGSSGSMGTGSTGSSEESGTTTTPKKRSTTPYGGANAPSGNSGEPSGSKSY